MSAEQKRIRELEEAVIQLCDLLEESRMGFPNRYGNLVRMRLMRGQRDFPFGSRDRTGVLPAESEMNPTTPPAEEKEQEPA